MKYIYVIFSLLCFSALVNAQDTSFLTLYEKSEFLKTPRYSETIEFCKKLDKASPILHYTTFGISPQGRDLPLLIADRNGNFTPETVRKSGNAVLLIQACIHPGESDGKDAGLMLLRDLVINKKNITCLIILPYFLFRFLIRMVTSVLVPTTGLTRMARRKWAGVPVPKT
jgi:hypothetical protein